MPTPDTTAEHKLAVVISKIPKITPPLPQPPSQVTSRNEAVNPHVNLRCPTCGYYAKTTKEWLAVKRLCCPIDGAELLTAGERGEKRGRG